MKRCLSFVFLFLVSFLFKNDVFALSAECTQEEQLRLRQLANATDISYEFYEYINEDNVMERGYKVIINNFNPDFYIYNSRKGFYFEYKGSANVVNDSFPSGGTYELPFYASDESPCKEYHILTKIIALPQYNNFYNDPLCKGHESYELCKKFTSLNVGSYDNFKRLMNQYIKDSNNGNEKPTEKPTEGTKNLWGYYSLFPKLLYDIINFNNYFRNSWDYSYSSS